MIAFFGFIISLFADVPIWVPILFLISTIVD